MRVQSLITLGFSSLTFGNPLPLPQGVGSGADSCPSDPLNADTWTKAKVDAFLVEAAGNYTRTDFNNIQSLADSFGAPNFFCGLDKFCNAGQPCLPITLPAWYAAVAIQNWNNYMNSLNTAITFASSIISLKLSEIVTDIMPDPVDNVTPLKDIFGIFSATISVIPFVGSLAAVSGTLTTGLGFVLARAKPPVPADKFLAWSDVASTMGDVVRDYQAAVSTATENIMNAPIDDADNGIMSIIKDGAFLGVAQNFTQAQLQTLVIDSITQNAIGKALQAQNVFVLRTLNILPGRCTVAEDEVDQLCIQNEGSDSFTSWSLLRATGGNSAVAETAIARTLQDKYKMTKEQILKGPTDCFDGNSKQQLQDLIALVGALPSDPTAPCVMNMVVCDLDAFINQAGTKSIMELCRDAGVPI